MELQEFLDFIKWANDQSRWITIPNEMAGRYIEYVESKTTSKDEKEVCFKCNGSGKVTSYTFGGDVAGSYPCDCGK